eukprot:123231_1
MSDKIWTNASFRIIVPWIIVIALLTILTYHSYRLCHCQKGLNSKGSPIKIFGVLSFQHLSFIVIIPLIIPAVSQAIMYTQQQPLLDATCRFATRMGIICVSISKLSVHLFVTVRSQVAHSTTNRLYTIGLVLTLSDVLHIIYVLSGIPTIISLADGALCESDVSLSVYIWFALNDFVIGMYCLLAFILPLRKYVWLEKQDTSPNTSDPELQRLAHRIMIFSGIALVSNI